MAKRNPIARQVKGSWYKPRVIKNKKKEVKNGANREDLSRELEQDGEEVGS